MHSLAASQRRSVTFSQCSSEDLSGRREEVRAFVRASSEAPTSREEYDSASGVVALTLRRGGTAGFVEAV